LNDREEQPDREKEVADLDTARMALRGALQSVRSLQDLNGKLKGELQDFLHREKALNERLIRLQTELNDSYTRLDKETSEERERINGIRETLRLEITNEQNHKWQSEIEALRQSVQNWTEVRRQKEHELKILKETLLSKEQEVFTLQKEKIAAEEKAHRDLIEAIKQSRSGVSAAIEEVVKSKDKEISELNRKLATQPKVIEERLQQVEQELHRKEQSLLLQFRDRQQALEFDWAHREKELWERATESREALERDLKNQWEERRKNLENDLEKRRTTLEIQFRQQEEESKRRERNREDALHQTWVAKEAALAQEWAEREQELAREFQTTLDQERARASAEITQIKEDTAVWHKNQEDTLRQKENDFNKAHQASEQQLRAAYRKKEEELLARHQQVSEMTQQQISDLMARLSEKEGFAKSAQERLAAAMKERDAITDRFGRLEADTLRRITELEGLIKTRDAELSALNQTTTTRDEARVVQLQALERDQLLKESELKVLREKIAQAETDRKTALDHAAALETEFTQRQQQLEEAFRAETETLRQKLTTSSQESAERQQVDQRQMAELAGEVQTRLAEVHGLTHQLQLARHDIEKLTQDSSDKQAKGILVRRQLEERLVQREAELQAQILTLEKERMSIEERLEARITELEQELARRLSEDRALQERFRQTEEFRVDLEKQAEMLRDRFTAHEKQQRNYEDEVRVARETAEKERIVAEQKLLLRIGELEALATKQVAEAEGLQEELARTRLDRAAELQTFETREQRLIEQGKFLEERLKTQEDGWLARLSSVQEEHQRLESSLREKIQAQDAAHYKMREQLLAQVTELEGNLRRRELEIKNLKEQSLQEERTRQDSVREANKRESALEERAQFLYKTLETQKAELENKLETSDREHLKVQDALRAQVLQLEASLNRKNGEVEDLKARLMQAHLLQNELHEAVAMLEARVMDREQALRTAAQTHLDSEQKLERSITDLQAALQRRDAEYLTVEKNMQELKREQHADAMAAAEREKQLEERLQNVDEKLHAQKEQITARLTGVERQRLQNEETLHVRAMDLEQRLSEKTALVKNLQEQVSRAGSNQEHLEKKIVSLEGQLSRLDQQLKVRETEFHSFKSTSQKELATLHETNQRKLLELQGQRLTLEAEFKGLQDALAAAEKEKNRLSEQKESLEGQLRAEIQEHRQKMDEWLKERMSVEEAHQRKVLELNETLATKTNALQAIENRLASSEGQRADRDKQSGLLQKEIHDLQLALAAQQEEFRARMAGFEKERAQLQETQQNRITHLESQMAHRESAIRTLQEKITQADADHQTAAQLAAQREAALVEKNKVLETSLISQKKDWDMRMEELLSQRVKTETAFHAQVVQLQETLAFREKDLISVKENLLQVEQARLMIDASAQQASSSFIKERQALEERLVNEAGKVRDLESQLRGHSARIKEADKALLTGEAEREALRMSLAALSKKLDEEIAIRDSSYEAKAQGLQLKMQSIEKEWRERFHVSLTESSARIESLQEKVVELECALGVRENDLSSLRQEISQLNVERDKLEDLVSEKEKQNQTLLNGMAQDKEEFSARLLSIQTESKAAEEALHAQLKNLRTVLEQRVGNEQQRAEGLDLQLAAQLSELRQLKAALSETRAEREHLLSTLAGEREKASAELKARDQSAISTEAEFHARLEAQAKEFKQRLTAAEQESTQRLGVLQARAADLEKAIAVQRLESEQRKQADLAALRSEHEKAEKELHARLLELRTNLAGRVADVQRLELQLRETEQERSALDQFSTASHAEAMKRREELEQMVILERRQVQQLETQCKEQLSELKQLQESLLTVRSERDHALQTLAAEREKTTIESKGRQKAVAEMESALRSRYETQLREAGERFTSLQERTLQLEKLAADKHAALQRLQETLQNVDAARARAEEQWALEAKERRTEKETADQALEEFSTRLNALQTARKSSEEALHSRLLELQDRLTARVSEIQKLELQLKETEQARVTIEHYSTSSHEEALQRQQGLEAALSAERDRAEALDTCLATQVSELKQLQAALAEMRAEREQLLATLTAEREKATAAIQALDKKSSTKESALHAQMQAQEKEFNARLATLDTEYNQRMAVLQNRTSELEKSLSVQRAEYEQRLAVAVAERAKAEKAMQARMSEIQGVLVTRHAEMEMLKMQLAAIQKEREVFEATATDQKTDFSHQVDALRQRAMDLERQVAEKQVSVDRLAVSLAELTSQHAHVKEQWALEAKERRVEKEAAARAQEEFTLRLRTLQSERKTSEDALHHRLLELQDTLAARVSEIQKLDLQLKETEQARAALEHYSNASFAEATQRRQELEAQFSAERDRAQALDTQLSAQLSELKLLQNALQETRVEREQVLASLSAEREKTAMAIKALEKKNTGTESAYLARLESQEKEFRARLMAMETDAAQRVSALQARTSELEKVLSVQRAEYEQRLAVSNAEHAKAEKALQTQLSEMQNSVIDRNGELAMVRQQLAAVQKERAALEAATGDQRQNFHQQTEALRQRAIELERLVTEKTATIQKLEESIAQLSSHYAHAKEQWALETQARQATQTAATQAKEEFTHRLATVQAERQAIEDALRKRLTDLRTELDLRVEAEHEKTQAADTQLAAQVSELQQLRAALEAVRKERQQLLHALAAEREKMTVEIKDKTNFTAEQKQAYEKRLLAQEKDFRERLTAVESESNQRLAALQARTEELEKALASQHSEYERQLASQRSDYEQQVAVLGAERYKVEKMLQINISDLQSQLTARLKEFEAVREQLNSVESHRQQGEASLSAVNAEHVKERKQWDMRLSEERAKAHALELQLKAQASQLQDVQAALASAQKENGSLSALFEEHREKMQAELLGRDAATAAQKDQYEKRLSKLTQEMRDRLQDATKEAGVRSASLLSRLAELERQGADKQAALERLRESLTDLDAKRAYAEAQWQLEIQERRTVQDAAAREKTDFAARLAAVQAERKAAEDALTQQLMELRDCLSTRTHDVQRLEQQLKETEHARAALEQYSTASHQDLSRHQEALTQELRVERDRALALEHRLAAQVSELKQLQSSLTAARAEREQFIAELTAEREKVTLEMKARAAESSEEMALLNGKLETAEKEFRARLSVVEAENSKRVTALQSRATDLEKSLIHQRAEHEQRVALAEAERIKTEKALQTKISELQSQWVTRGAELDALRLQLNVAHTRAQAAHQASEEQKQTWMQQQAQLQKRMHELEQEIAGKQATIERLQEATAQLEAQRASAEEQWAIETQERRNAQELNVQDKEEFAKRAKALEAERKVVEDQLQKKLSEARDLKEALAAEQKQFKASVERNEAHERRIDELHQRSVELERQSAEKQGLLDGLRETLAELESKRTQAEKQKEELAARLTALQAERKMAEDALHQRLLDLRTQLEHQLHGERDRSRTLDGQLSTQLAELKQLRSALADEKAEREQLTKTLAAEREKALAEIKGREKVSAETTSTLWSQMEAQEKEFRAQLAAVEQEAARRIGVLQTRATELEKTLAAQRSEFEQRLLSLQTERTAAEEKLHVKIFNLEEQLSRRIAEAQKIYAEYSAVESARAVAEESASTAHGEMVRQQQLFDERLIQEQSQVRSLEQQLLQHKTQVREAKEALAMAKEERRLLETAWNSEKQKIMEDLRVQGLSAQDAREEQQSQMSLLERQWAQRMETAAKESAQRLQTVQSRLNDLERQLAQRERETQEWSDRLHAAQTEQEKIQEQLTRADQEKMTLNERTRSLEEQLVLEREAFEERLEVAQATHAQSEHKLRGRLTEMEEQLSRKSSALLQIEERLEQTQKSYEEIQKLSDRDHASLTHQREDLEKKLAAERNRLHSLETEQAAQKKALRDLQETLVLAQKEREEALDTLKAQKERFLTDLALRDAGSAQRQRALELEREALDKQWQDRLKSATHETVERMETLRRRADDLEKQLALRNAEVHEAHDRAATLEHERRDLQEKIITAERKWKEEFHTAGLEQARLVERCRVLEERLQEQSRTLNVHVEQDERERTKAIEHLQHRLMQAQEQLAKRTAELKTAEERVRTVEETRAQLEKSSGQGHSQWARERAQLEERLSAERAHVRELSEQLADAVSQSRGIKEALATAEQERRTHVKTLAAHQENEKLLESRIVALEKDLRAPLENAKGESATQARQFHQKTQELEKDLAARDSAIERLRLQAEQAEKVWAQRLDELESRQATEIEKRVAERLREQMMGALESGQLKNANTSAMQTLLEEWVFGFAHQVRNPLGIIRSVAESLMEANPRRNEERDSLNAIVKAVDGLNLRLREFIEFSKPVKPLLKSIDLPEAIAAAIRLVDDKLSSRNVTIKTQLPQAGTRVWMDADHLRTIVVQLLRNASDAMPKGGIIQVKVSYDASREKLEISVQDQGTGIPREHLKEIGRPFFSTKPGAVGLGLALIKRLLRAYDGKMDIESQAGRSTTVICRLKTTHEQAGQWAA